MRSVVFGLVALLTSVAAASEPLTLYIGTGATGIYRSQFDPETGSLTQPEMAAETARPSFLWVHPDGHSLYSVSEVRRSGDRQGAAIVAWANDSESGELTERNRQDAHGSGPCFVSVRDDGRYAAIANYASGSVTLYPLDPDGSSQPASGHVEHSGSSVNPRRQQDPHAHSIRFDPSGKRVAAADLGTDRVYLYDIAEDGSLAAADPPSIQVAPGSGPRHFVFSPDGSRILVLGELSGTITVADYAPPEIETLSTTSTMAAGVPEDAQRASAEILFHPSGRFVYASNRGPSEIAVFDYDAESGDLKRTFAASSGGAWPRNFRFSPDGEYLLAANQKSNNVVVFRVDPASGRFEPTGTEIEVPQPMCLKFAAPQSLGSEQR